MWCFATLAACSGGNDVAPDAPAVESLDIDAAAPDATPDAPEPVFLELTLERREETGPDVILVDVLVRRGQVPQTGAAVTLTATAGSSVGAIADQGNGHYTAEVTPTIASGDVELTVTALGAELRRTAIVLPTIDAAWGQPERVPGLVNTAGYEDSAEISPDGRWLLVSSYSPVDLICCLGAIPTICTNASTAADPASVACNTSLGPYAAPARPDLPGAERITSATNIHDELPRLGLDQPAGTDLPFPVPPLAAYGFVRQDDGSYGEPFSIAFEADGMTGAPFGLTFAAPPTGTEATLVYAWDDHRTDGDANTFNDLYRASVTLGARVIFGTFTAGVLDIEPTHVPLASHAGWQGNPGVAADGIFFDAEQGDNDIHFAPGDPLGGDPLAAAVTVGISTAAAEYQPFVHDDRLYYARDFNEIRSARREAGDVSLSTTWTGDHAELGLDGANDVGRVLAIGEPSIAVTSSGTELYFVYGQRSATGIEQSIARVRLR